MTLVRIQQSSMQWSDPRAQKAADAAKVFDYASHAIGFCEVGAGQNPAGRALLAAQAKAHDYGWYPGGAEGALAIRFKAGKVIDHGYEGPIIPGKAGDHPHLGLTWVDVRHRSLGMLSFGVAHWLNRDNEPARHRLNDAMSRVVSDFMAAKAKGGARASFVMGDANRDDATQELFPGLPFTTIYDHLGVWPNTHGSRTIDFVASYDGDRARVHPRAVRRLPVLYSDHRSVQADYNIDRLAS